MDTLIEPAKRRQRPRDVAIFSSLATRACVEIRLQDYTRAIFIELGILVSRSRAEARVIFHCRGLLCSFCGPMSNRWLVSRAWALRDDLHCSGPVGDGEEYERDMSRWVARNIRRLDDSTRSSKSCRLSVTAPNSLNSPSPPSNTSTMTGHRLCQRHPHCYERSPVVAQYQPGVVGAWAVHIKVGERSMFGTMSCRRLIHTSDIIGFCLMN